MIPTTRNSNRAVIPSKAHRSADSNSCLGRVEASPVEVVALSSRLVEVATLSAAVCRLDSKLLVSFFCFLRSLEFRASACRHLSKGCPKGYAQYHCNVCTLPCHLQAYICGAFHVSWRFMYRFLVRELHTIMRSALMKVLIAASHYIAALIH